MITAVLVKEW